MTLFIIQVVSFLFVTTTLAQNISMSKPTCQEKCGNVTIPYPFGIGPECCANPSFEVTCLNSTSPPILRILDLEIVNISLYGVVIVNQPVSPISCKDAEQTGYLNISLARTPFTISSSYNSLAVLGCTNSVWLHANQTIIGGCSAICKNDNSTDKSCNGVNCCQVTIPPGLQELQYTYRSSETSSSSSCGYFFPVNKKWFQDDYTTYEGLQSNLSYPYDPEFSSAPLALDWEFDPEEPILYADCRDLDAYRFSSSLANNLSAIYYRDYDYVSSTKYCSCTYGFEGNPYIPGGCSDIDECKDPNLYRCGDRICINKIGYYQCSSDKKNISRVKIPLISIGSALGALFLLFVAWKSTRFIIKRIKESRKHRFFKKNGGLLLEQQLKASDNGLDRTKLFGSKELAHATDHYNENRILGRGGQGTVYKGMLTDGRIVAVKKSKKVEEGDVEVFINEVVILSQVNHRNVVKLLGCCLETEVPLLVYEFIPNGTLFQHVHDPSDEFPLTWKMRVRIAREIAGALAYLHSSASAPIYHRDIKSTNVLLDDKYRAKISDFGMSRSVAIDQTHLTTRVIGTFGYLDPEYFQSSQFTEKSDVYSFGVVMVELLTGEKAISSIRAEVGRSLATHFLDSMERNELFEILDARVLKEGKHEEIVVMAELARKCLHLNGRRRPTMKEVAAELDGVQKLKQGSFFLQNHENSMTLFPDEVAHESYDFSSITESMHFDPIHQSLIHEP